jgi:hypothetical protein
MAAGDDPQGLSSVGRGRTHLTHLTHPAQVIATVAVVAVVATAMALLLAQSAGAIHLGFLGPVG